MTRVAALDLRQRAPATTAPSNVEAEQALLGSILFDNEALHRCDGAVSADDFHEPFHGRLFAAMAEMIRRGQLAEPIILMDRFRGDPAFEELGGVVYLADLVDRAPPAANAPDYARLVHDLAVRRELIRLGGEISAAAANDVETPTAAQIEAAEQGLYSLAETGRGHAGEKTFAEALTGAVELAAAAYERDGGMSGIPTGLADIDRLLGGLQASDLVILAARPSMGKSSLAGNIAFEVARRYRYRTGPDGGRETIDGGVVQFFSLEMSAEQLALRIASQVSGVPSDRIRRGDIEASEFGRFRDAVLEIQEAPLYIDDTGNLPIAQLCARARRRKRTSGLDLIVVDYLQLAAAPGRKGEGRVQEVTEITGALKALAKELSVPVLALAQLSRQVENRDDKKPQLSDLRESGSIEQDADVVMFLYREAYYLGRTEPRAGTPEHLAWQEDMDKVRHVAEVIVGKQRHGPIGAVKLHFNENLTLFSNLAMDARYEPRAADRSTAAPQRQVVFSGVRDPSGRD